MLNLTILWEDRDIMIINKPPFVVVNRAESIKGETVQDWADRHCEECTHDAAIHIDRLPRYARNDKETRDDEEVFSKRSGVAHRLDKETSGCLLIAKNPTALKSLLRQFRDREIKKEYLALVHGRMTPASGTIRLPLSRSRYDREKWEIRYSGKMAETTWLVEKYFSETTLVRLFPMTGRTHQIRVHLAHLGFPIFSDEKYLTRSLLAGDRARLARHFLHAETIVFKSLGGLAIKVSAELGGDLEKVLEEERGNLVY